jgi:hypothetical protein
MNVKRQADVVIRQQYQAVDLGFKMQFPPRRREAAASKKKTGGNFPCRSD